VKFGIADYGVNVWDGGLYDIELRLEELREIGFDGTERLEAISPSDALTKAARYKRLGMDFATCRGPSVQTGIEWTAALGKSYVWLTPGECERKVDFDVYCRRANRMAQACANYGLQVGLHNHLGQRIENQQELEDFMQRCPGVSLLLDIGHLAGAGGDPVAIVKKYHKRLCAVHLKDIVMKDATIGLDKWWERLRFCELGGGNVGLDIKGVIKALVECGYDGWVHIEHDTHLDEPVRDLAKSYNYLVNAGFTNR